MAGIIRSKGPQIFTANVRQVDTDTGDDYVTSALQRATQRASDAIYNEAVYEQQELGRATALKATYANEDGTLVYEDITEDMSRMAKQAARPVIERNYGIAFKNQMQAALNADRAAAEGDPERFDEISTITIRNLVDAVPPEFAHLGRAVMEGTAADLQNQHKFALTLERSREQERISLENLQLDYQNQTDYVATLVRGGDLEGGAAMRDAILADLSETGVADGLTDQNIKAIKDRLNYAYHGTLTQQRAVALLPTDEALVLKMERAFHSGLIPEDDADILESIGITQELVDQVENHAVRQAIAADIKQMRSSFASEQATLAENARLSTYANDLFAGRANRTGQKAEKDLDIIMEQFGISRTSWSSGETLNAVSTNSRLRGVLENGNVLPHSFINELQGVASGELLRTEDELRNLATLYNISTKGIGMEGSVSRAKGLEDAKGFWDNIHYFTNSFGTSEIAEGVAFFTDANSAKSTRADAILLKFNEPDGNARQLVRSRLMDESIYEDDMEDIPPSAVDRMMNIAMNAYATFDKKTADEFISDAYQSLYAKSEIIKMPNTPEGITIKRSEFAPEAFYQGGDYDLFAGFVEAKISKVLPEGSATALGREYFLYPTNQSTNARVEWLVVDRNGEFVRNKDGYPMSISSSQVNQNMGMSNSFTKGIDRKLAKARELRDDLISLDETGMEKQTRKDLDEALQGFERSGIL